MIPSKWQQLFIQEENVIILLHGTKIQYYWKLFVKSYRLKMLTLLAKMNRLAWPL